MTCSPEALENFSIQAKDEIGESSIDLKTAVENVKKLLVNKYEDLRLPPNVDILVERCLRNRKFDESQAAVQVHSYFKLLRDMRELHKVMYFLPSMHRNAFLDSMFFTKLKYRDSKGRDVILCNFDRIPTKNFSLDEYVATLILLMDECARVSVETQRIGMIFLFNFKGYEFGHAKHFTFARLRLVAKTIQGAFPIRYKGFYCVRVPKIFLYVWAFFQNFLQEKTRNRFHIYGEDLTGFYDHVSPDILPDFMGGKLSYEESIDVDFARNLITRDAYYKELFQYGYMKDTNGN